MITKFKTMIDASPLEAFRKAPLFDALTDDGIMELAPKFHPIHYDKDGIIFYERDLPKDHGRKIYVVLDGCVKLVKYSNDGESTIVRLASGGEFFGVTGALTNRPYPFSAEALSNTNIMSIGYKDFLEVMAKFPQIASEMIVELGEMLWFNYETHNQVVKKTDARIAKILLYHLRRDGYQEIPEGKQINLQLPHEYLASMTGIAYEESVRIMSRLKKSFGCLQYLRGGKIIISDENKLKELAQVDEAWGY